MRPLALLPALAGMLFVAAPSWGQAFHGHAAPPQAANCARCGAPLAPHHHDGHGHHHGDGTVPCAEFGPHQPSTDPLPPITLSRYVDKDEFACVKKVYGDGYPHFPGFWFHGQRYPAPHDYRGAGGGGGGMTGGRGIGVGSQPGSAFQGINPSGVSGGHGIGVGQPGTGPFQGINPTGPAGGHGVGVQ